MKQRIEYFDSLRGLAIMMVVGIHTYVLSDSLITMAIRQVFNCAVPLFLAISGYFMSHKDVSNKEKYLSFLKKQVPRVYIPCLLWSLPWFLMDLLKDGFCFTSVLLLLIGGYSIFYFISLIIQYYLLLPVLQKVKTYSLLGLMCFVSLFCIALVTYLLHFKHIDLPLIAFAGPFPLWIAFFCVGILLGVKGRNYNVGLIIMFTIISLVLSVLETKHIFLIDGGGVGVKLSSFLFSFFAVLLLFSQKTENFLMKLGGLYRLLIWIGGLSFGIYLCHCLFVTCLSIINLPSFLNCWIVRWTIILFFSSMIVATGRKFFPWTVKYLGFR